MMKAQNAPVKPVTAYLALGSNLGDREATIRSAIKALGVTRGIDVVRASSMHETDPVGPSNQDRYINAAVMVQTSLSPSDLLTASLDIEISHGRRRTEQARWTARTLDIDVLLYGDEIIDDAGPPRLRVPHPHMAERSFVLDPLVEIASDVIHPILNKSIRSLLDQLRTAEYQPRPLCSP
jgi:2-amino-4-hydroxy-6-hydroxymethyldihydropteridine diphosphokinase